MYIENSILIPLFILAYFGLGFIIFLITKKKKSGPIKASDIIDDSVEYAFKTLNKELQKSIELMNKAKEESKKCNLPCPVMDCGDVSVCLNKECGHYW